MLAVLAFHLCLLSASLESQKVIDHLSKFHKDGPDRMAKEIVDLSSKMWKQEEEGVRDDITAVIICFKD
jgi:hypothetical protein